MSTIWRMEYLELRIAVFFLIYGIIWQFFVQIIMSNESQMLICEIFLAIFLLFHRSFYGFLFVSIFWDLQCKWFLKFMIQVLKIDIVLLFGTNEFNNLLLLLLLMFNKEIDEIVVSSHKGYSVFTFKNRLLFFSFLFNSQSLNKECTQFRWLQYSHYGVSFSSGSAQA